MRDIQFRGRRIDNQQWAYGFVGRVQQDNGNCTYLISEDTTQHQRNVRQTVFEVYEGSIGQFTGIVDKDNKFIYEGDIIKLNPTNINNFEVMYSRGGFIALHTKDDTNSVPLGYFISDYERVVVGNIHQNPELLQ